MSRKGTPSGSRRINGLRAGVYPLSTLVAAFALAACVPAGPVVRQVDDGVIAMGVFDTGGNGELVSVGMGPGLIVTGAADATDARRAIHAFCGSTTPFNPEADSDPLRLNPETGAYEMPGSC
jgi:hypothetical protein